MSGGRSMLHAATPAPTAMAHGTGVLFAVGGVLLLIGIAAVVLAVWGGRRGQ